MCSRQYRQNINWQIVVLIPNPWQCKSINLSKTNALVADRALYTLRNTTRRYIGKNESQLRLTRKVLSSTHDAMVCSGKENVLLFSLTRPVRLRLRTHSALFSFKTHPSKTRNLLESSLIRWSCHGSFEYFSGEKIPKHFFVHILHLSF